MSSTRIEVRTYDWMHTREFRLAHRKDPDPRWWGIVDGFAAPGPKHYEIVNFVTAEEFRFAGFDIDPAAAFVVTNFSVGGVDVPMAYPFSAVHMFPRSRDKAMLIPADTGVCVTLRNDRRDAVPFTVRILEPRDLR